MIKIAPSILSADFSVLGQQIKEIEAGGADWVHIDVMDGMFVPNISFGIPVIKSIRKITKLPFDVHLMIEEPSRYINDFVNAGADIITIHEEAERHLDRAVNLIKSLGVKAGVALNPATPVSTLDCVLPLLDTVLIMSVNPGFGGQKYISYSADKVKELREKAKSINPSLIIEVDGGVDKNNVGLLYRNGTDVVVAGSAVFSGSSIKDNIKALREG